MNAYQQAYGNRLQTTIAKRFKEPAAAQRQHDLHRAASSNQFKSPLFSIRRIFSYLGCLLPGLCTPPFEHQHAG